jgi:hypothetical protein
MIADASHLRSKAYTGAWTSRNSNDDTGATCKEYLLSGAVDASTYTPLNIRTVQMSLGRVGLTAAALGGTFCRL